MRGGRCAEQLRELVLPVLGQMVLAAKEDDLVLEQRAPDHRDGCRVHLAAEPDIVDLGADASADSGHDGGCLGVVDRHEITFAGLNRLMLLDTETPMPTRVFVAVITTPARGGAA